MKTRLILPNVISLFLYTCALSAQVTPMFEMPLYFEDAVGNKDTVTIGYDTTSSSYHWNQQFGEHAINLPFDSIFEVRVSHSDLWPVETGKKAIAGWELDVNQYCGGAAPVKLFVHARHFPLTIRYDTALIHSSECRKQMIIAPSVFVFLLENWWDSDHYCMWETDEIKDSSIFIVLPNGNPSAEEFEVEGQGVQRIPCYFWTVFWGNTPCGYPVSTDNVNTFSSKRLWPNPATNQIIFDLSTSESVSEISIFDLIGRHIKTVLHPLDNILNISELKVGYYVAMVRYVDGKSTSFRFIKEE
ncbi:MAG: T9SS type A sorting domain-containing protein [Bacteroidota bacterium]